jgi:hypothetical protein
MISSSGSRLCAIPAWLRGSGTTTGVLVEADGDRRLLVFDNADDLDMLRPFLPAAGEAQVIVTSSRRSAAGLGTPVPVDVFTEGEALAFLAERTGLGDAAGALEVARELGFLPLGLAQAVALIAREHLNYWVYLGRLRSLPAAGYLRRAEGDAYPYRLAEADAGLGDPADASLLGFTVDGGSVVVHRLVMRVIRERLATGGGLPAVLDGAVRVLAGAADTISEAWRDPAGVRDLAGQVSAVTACPAVHPDIFAGGMLGMRLRSVYLLNELGDSTGLAILAAEPLAADCERLLGAGHPITKVARKNLAALTG